MHKMMILSILFFLNLPFLSAGNPQIVDVDFNRHSGILHVQARGSYSGPMVQGMNQDFTAWSSGVCRAESGTDTLGDTFLRFFIDKPGGVSIDDCVAMSQALDAPLDEADPIDRSYSLQVQSPGLERELTRDFHFAQFLGADVTVRFIRAQDGRREYKGKLLDYADGSVTVACDDGATRVFDKKEASWIKLDDFGGF